MTSLDRCLATTIVFSFLHLNILKKVVERTCQQTGNDDSMKMNFWKEKNNCFLKVVLLETKQLRFVS